jgi:DNA-binding transcriptional MerR regulator
MSRKDAKPPGFDVHRAERLHFILEMRKSGASYRAIAQHLRKLANDGELNEKTGAVSKAPKEWDIGHVQVRSEVRAALKELEKENAMSAKEVKRLEIERLDQQLLAAWPLMLKGDANAHWIVLAISKRRCELENVANVLKFEHELKKPKDARSALAELLGVSPEQIPAVEEESGKKKKR